MQEWVISPLEGCANKAHDAFSKTPAGDTRLPKTRHHSRRQRPNQRRNHLQADRLLGGCITGDSEAILDFRDLSKVQLKNDSVKAFGSKWDEAL